MAVVKQLSFIGHLLVINVQIFSIVIIFFNTQLRSSLLSFLKIYPTATVSNFELFWVFLIRYILINYPLNIRRFLFNIDGYREPDKDVVVIGEMHPDIR